MESNTCYEYTDIYTEEGREDMVENDEISLLEEAFMEGYATAM